MTVVVNAMTVVVNAMTVVVNAMTVIASEAKQSSVLMLTLTLYAGFSPAYPMKGEAFRLKKI